MPRYTYECSECDEIFLVMHSFGKKLSDCDKCGTTDSLKRIITAISSYKKKDDSRSNVKTGSLVNKKIEEFKEDLKKEKKKLKEVDYEPI